MCFRIASVRPRYALKEMAGITLSLVTLTATGCSSVSPAPPQTTTEALWGGMTPVVSVKELMRYTIDPLADDVFNAVGSVTTERGVVNTVPTSDADWERIEAGAISLAEAAYLLKVRRPFAPPGDLNESAGPDPVELSPAQIAAKVEKDPVEWNARIETLRNAALAARDVVKAKDVNGLWDAGEVLDQACENCHRAYWYPGEDAEFYRRLGKRFDASAEPRTKRERSSK